MSAINVLTNPPAQAAQTFPIAFVANHTSPVTHAEQVDWEALSNRLARCDIGEKNGPGWMPADIEPGARNGESVKSVSFLVLDVEAKCETDKVTGEKKITGPETPTPDEMFAELGLSGWCCILHTSYNHTAEHARYRLIFQLSRPLAPQEVKPLGLLVAQALGIDDCLDTGCLEPARLFYLPRCPSDRADLFCYADVPGDALSVDDLLAGEAWIKNERKAAATTRRKGQSGSVIDAFNAGHDVGAILEQHGYVQHGRRRWLWPGSTTRMAGVRLLPDAVPLRVYSSHGGDPLNDGHAHDAFGLFRILDHGGDVKVAVKDAARICGMDPRKAPPASASALAAGQHQPDDNNAALSDPAVVGGAPAPYIGFAFKQAGELLSQPKPIQWLIRGMLEQGVLGQLFGDSGCGKSFLAIDWGCCIATDTEWQGKEVGSGAVFYIAGEGHAGIGRRLKAWEVHNETPLTDAPFFVSTTPAALMDVTNAASVAKAVEDLVERHGAPRLIIVDTLARNLGNGEENSNAEIGLFINNIDIHLRTRFGAAVLVVHHTGHAEKDRGRGASSLRAAMDYEYRLAIDGEIRTLVCTKAKESELPPPMGFKLAQIVLDGWKDEDGELMTSAVLVGSDEKAKGKKSRLSGANRIAHDALTQALAEDGQTPGPEIVKEFGELLAPVRVVHEEVWRKRAYDMGISDGEQDAKQKAFSRSRKALLDMYLVSVWNGFYWRGIGVPGHRTETGQCPVLSPTEPDRTGHTPIGVSGVRVGTPGEEAEENQMESEAFA